MQRKPITTALAFVGALALAAAAPSFAQTGSTGGTSGSTGASSGASSGSGTSSGTMSKGSTGTTAGAKGQSFDKTSTDTAGSWNSWNDSQAKSNNGRISRKAYMDEMGRRWDAADSNKQGLTPAEVSRMYGNVDSAAMPAKTGSGVQPGNMGPGNQKGQ